MAAQYSKEENDRWAESQRLEGARRVGMGLPNRPGMMTPPRPQSEQRVLPPHLGGPPTRHQNGPRVSDQAVAAPRRDLPATDVPGAMLPAQPVDQESVVKASAQGFSNGFLGGVTPKIMGTPGVAEATGFVGSTGQEGMPSALGAVAEIAEAAEASSIQSADLAARMERFPELRGVEVPTGNAAKFPELTEQAPRPDVQQQEQDGGYER